MHQPLSRALFASLLLLSPLAQATEPSGYNQVSLTAEVRQQLPLDRMRVTLYTEEQGEDPAQLASRITETINAALGQARQQNVQVSLGNRSSYPVHDSKGRSITAWRERAELRIEGSDFPALSKLTGELLSSLQFGNLQFSLSSERRQEAEDALIEDLIARFNQRAGRVGKSLGASDYKLVRLDINTSGGGGMPMPRAYAMRAMSSAPVSPEIEAGSTELVLQATGVIEVQKH